MNNSELATSPPKPVIYSCSGCSDAGELADRVARSLDARNVGEMSCLAGVAGRVKPLLQKAQRAEEIIVIDGCPLNCARHTLLNAGLAKFTHFQLHQFGHRKGQGSVTPERLERAVASVEQHLIAGSREKSETDAAQNLPASAQPKGSPREPALV